MDTIHGEFRRIYLNIFCVFFHYFLVYVVGHASYTRIMCAIEHFGVNCLLLVEYLSTDNYGYSPVLRIHPDIHTSVHTNTRTYKHLDIATSPPLLESLPSPGLL